MHKVCTGIWRKDMQGFYGDLEERIYKLSRQELQKVSEKISRVRNILQDCQFYLYNNSGRLVNRNCYFFLQDTGMRGDLNTVPELTAKQDQKACMFLNEFLFLSPVPLPSCWGLKLRLTPGSIPSVINRKYLSHALQTRKDASPNASSR